MNAPANNFPTEQRAQSCDEFEKQRAQFLQQWASFELVIAQCLMKAKHGWTGDGQSLGQRLAELRRIESSAGFSHKLKAKLEELPTLVEQRNAIVHGLMTTAVRDSVPIAMFQSIDDAALELPRYLVLDKPAFVALTRTLRSKTQCLGALLTPPSPRPPTPAAATGP